MIGIIGNHLTKQLKRLDLDSQSSLEFPDFNGNKEDIEFGIELFEKAILILSDYLYLNTNLLLSEAA